MSTPARAPRPGRAGGARLLADIGSTFARFALEVAPGRFEHPAELRCADHADVASAVSTYLASVPAGAGVRHAAVATANPVDGDGVRLTNSPWAFSIEHTRQRLGLQTLVVLNDFTALAMSLPRLAPHDLRQVGGGTVRPRQVMGLLGAGSGLGMSGVIPVGEGWMALASEGGHASFAPRDERELTILRHAWTQFDHVSFERLLSGPGLELMHRALAGAAGQPPTGLTAPQITQRALDGADPVCRDALDAFCAMLGTAAGNLAMTLGARGGIYIGGSIVPRLGAYFDRSPFRSRFEDKGRLAPYVRDIPTFVITSGHATFLGASAVLDVQLRDMADAAASSLLAQVQRVLGELTPAERRVADQVLAHPRAVLNDPIAEIARAAQVSQPTVIRFCRSLGCEGLSDFKLRLASSLTGTVPITHTPVATDDSMAELGGKVLGNTASAILQLRSQLNRESCRRATELLRAAHRVDLYAAGPYGVVVQDAQFKFLRLGLPSMACTDPRLQRLAADVLTTGDVALVISPGGHQPELLEVVRTAQSRGAQVIALTASQTPLARQADVALIVDHPDDMTTHLPMVSRILHLLVIDILAVGLAMRGQAEKAGSAAGKA